MKKIISYSFLVLVLFAFNYKSIKSFLPPVKKSIELVQDYDCEKEESSESEKSGEKDSKKEYSEYLFFHKINSIDSQSKKAYSQQKMLLFSPSDFSQGVYSPPEYFSYI